jgi:hypothetical protein
MVNHNRGKPAFFAVLILCLISPCIVYAVSAQSATTVTAEASSSQLKVGDTLTVTLKVSDAVDLYGVDVTLSWNTSVLEAVSATNSLGVESHSNGVLHASSAYPIDVEDDAVTDGQYHLLATSQGSSTPSFSGSGTIATITFNVTGSGSANLSLDDVELSTRDSLGEISLVTPQTDVSTVTTTIPEFPVTALIIALAVAAAAIIIIVTKKIGNPMLSIAKNVNYI